MFSLQGLLNPREERGHQDSHDREASSPAVQLVQAAKAYIQSEPRQSCHTSQTRYYAHYLSHRGIHEAHIGCPNSLSCLADLDTEPTIDSTETLVRCAILGSADGHLSVDDILSALQGKYYFYRAADRERELKHSVTYLLATSPAFIRESHGVRILWGATNLYRNSEQSAVVVQSPTRSACASSPSIGPPPSAISSYSPSSILSTYPEEIVDSRGIDTKPSDGLAPTAAASPLSYPSVFSYGPASASIGAPLLRVDENGQHPPHVNCPNTLSCLQDMNDKPTYTLPTIIRAAILGSTSGRLTITDIYAAIIEKYPYFASLPLDDSWKQSVRHHLSLSNRFVKVERRANEPGRGAYWAVDLEAPPGTKRPRKRNRKAQDGPPRPRGRPRKVYDQPVGYGPDYDKPIPLPALTPHKVSSRDWQLDEDASYDEDEGENALRGQAGQMARAGLLVFATPRLRPVHW